MNKADVDKAESRGARPRPPARGWVGTLTIEILKGTSPELAIKIAYDFGRSLRLKDPDGENLTERVEKWVLEPFKDSPLLRYIHAGFAAGHGLKPLPWKRQIDAVADGAGERGH